MHKKNQMAISAEKKNNTLIAQVIKGKEAVFARIDANLGSYFRLTIHNGNTPIQILGSPRGLFKQRKAQIRFSRNDIVLLECMPTGSTISEIVALVSKSEAKELYKEGRIHKAVYSEEEVSDFFEQDADADTNEDVEVNPDSI